MTGCVFATISPFDLETPRDEPVRETKPSMLLRLSLKEATRTQMQRTFRFVHHVGEHLEVLSASRANSRWPEVSVFLVRCANLQRCSSRRA